MKCILYNPNQNRCDALEYYEFKRRIKNGTCDNYKCPFFKEYYHEKRTIKEDEKRNGKVNKFWRSVESQKEEKVFKIYQQLIVTFQL